MTETHVQRMERTGKPHIFRERGQWFCVVWAYNGVPFHVEWVEAATQWCLRRNCASL